MEKSIRLNRAIYPDFEDLEWKTKLENVGLKIRFLVDEGIELKYDDNKLEPYKKGEDSVEFYDPKTRRLMYSYVENFGYLEFYRGMESEPFVKIEIIDFI